MNQLLTGERCLDLAPRLSLDGGAGTALSIVLTDRQQRVLGQEVAVTGGALLTSCRHLVRATDLGVVSFVQLITETDRLTTRR